MKIINIFSTSVILLTILLSQSAISQEDPGDFKNSDPDASYLEPVGLSATMEEVVVQDRKPVTAASNREVRERDFELLPIITDPGELLRVVPGLITLQHAGGGKADQYFLRGFDADHGTDVALFVDELPVNMRSHAHGQGYADLHFVIPETIESIGVFKGPYFAEFGDFANAGAIRLNTKDSISEGYVQTSGGLYAVDRFRPLARGLTLFSPVKSSVATSLGAFEILYDEGPFINENGLVRLNGFGKFKWKLTHDSTLEIWGSGFYSNWDASGQIPVRAVESGELDRFGSVDPTEGGDTQRYNLYIEYSKLIDEKSDFSSTFYFTRYKLDLFSNFTFFLNDPVNGDGIVQRDNRYMYGTDTRYNRFFSVFGRTHFIRGGIQARADHNHLVFANQTQREQTTVINDTDIFEVSFSPWLEADLTLNDWIRAVVGFRWDLFHYDVNDNLPSNELEGNDTSGITSYKANLILSPVRNTDFYFNFGTGFHSNDARVAATGGSETLPRSIGFEIGSRTRLLDNRLDIAGAFWYLYLEDELVFVGDEGIFEPSGSTRRYGGEIEARVSLYDRWVFLHGDLNLVDAEFTDGGEVPLAPRITSRSGVVVRTPFNLEGALEVIYLGDRPAEETDTFQAEGFTRVDLTLNYRYGNLEFFTIVENLFNTDYREAQFFNPSRLPDEPEGVEDIHFVPGNPFTFRAGITYYLSGITQRL